MKSWRAIIIVGVVSLWLVASFVYEIIVNEPIHFYTEAPHRLLYVAIMAIAGGLALLIFDRLPPQARHYLKLCSLGGAATLLTVFWFNMVYLLIGLPEFILRNAGVGWVALVLVVNAALAGYFWKEFCRTWKTKHLLRQVHS